jgi:hypothetical protein
VFTGGRKNAQTSSQVFKYFWNEIKISQISTYSFSNTSFL